MKITLVEVSSSSSYLIIRAKRRKGWERGAKQTNEKEEKKVAIEKRKLRIEDLSIT